MAAGLLWLLFRGTDWEAFFAALSGVGWGWLLMAQVFAWSSNFTRVRRWSYVVRAVQPASFRQLLSATQIGFLVNFTVPARLGELVRAWLLSRFTGQGLPRSVSMVALDRVFDVIGLLAIMVGAALAFDRDRDVEIAAGAFGNPAPFVVSSAVVRPAATTVLGVLIVAALGLVVLHRRQSLVLRLTRAAFGWLSTGLAERLAGILNGFADGLHVFRSGRDLARAVSWSLATWGGGVLSLATIMLAFGLPSPWAASLLAVTLIAVSISVPLAPAAVGQYHLPVVAAVLLSYPGLEPARAKAVAVVAHLSAMVPIAGLGLYCLKRESLGLLRVIRRGRGAGQDARRSRPASRGAVAP